MSDIVIKTEDLGKLYRLGEIGTGTLSHDLNRWLARIRGKEDPFAKVGETNDRTVKSAGNYVWALKDINFEVRKGEVLGIIGRNGAGKSTLLKILSKVTTPSSGRIKLKGRIASLLEVGTGFHPELTGRENIYLNGAILGMTKAEIRSKFDEIVDFAGVERYIDTPVKRYSSGMYVRLAFAVAAFLEPEILIVDEVLAVGDAEFQKKCIGRMKDVSANDGRTVLFVSHNLHAIENLCTSCIVLSNGHLKFQGNVADSLEEYRQILNIRRSSNLQERKDRMGNGKLSITNFYISDFNDNFLNTVQSGTSFQFVIEFENKIFPERYKSVIASIALIDNKSQVVFLVRTNFSNQNLEINSKSGKVYCQVDDFPLAQGSYSVVLFLGYGETEIYDLIDDAAEVIVEGGDYFGTGSIGLPTHCKVLNRSNWKINESII